MFFFFWCTEACQKASMSHLPLFTSHFTAMDNIDAAASEKEGEGEAEGEEKEEEE